MSDSEQSTPKEPLSVYVVLMAMVEQMSMIAWQKLGLQPDMVTGTLEKDLDQARVAVDVMAGLAGFLEPELDEEDKRRIHTLVRDLKLNYVEQRKAGASD